MEKDKYYTPSPEEFHVGFEYETCYTIESANGKKPIDKDFIPKLVDQGYWDKRIFDTSDSVDVNIPHDIFINYENNKQLFRVKYLDKEDMESIKFFYGRDLPDKGLEDYKEFYYLLSINLSKTYDVMLVTNYKETLIYKNLNLIFRGKLKNLSELKILLKQLNIL